MNGSLRRRIGTDASQTNVHAFTCVRAFISLTPQQLYTRLLLFHAHSIPSYILATL
jgi:hypothetical protein